MLAIIIVNYKSSDDISICLDSIVKFEKKYNEYEIIIVDNNSFDQGLDQLKIKFPFIKIIKTDKNGGFAYGNNVGINNLHSDYILLLNPDTYINDNAIEKLYDRIKSDNSIGIIGPLIQYPDGKNQSYYLPKTYLNLWRLFCERFYLHRIFKKSLCFNSYYRTYMDYSKEMFVEQVSGAAFLFRKNILEKTGLFDQNYFLYFEESDFCLQAVKHHIKQLFFPESMIIHKGGLNCESGWEKTSQWYTDSFKYYFKKNFKKPVYFTALLFFTLGAFLRFFLFLLQKDNRYKFHLIQFKKMVKS